MPRVCLVLFPQFQMLAYVLATETLRIANRCAGEPCFSWETRTATGGVETASNGALVSPDKTGWSGGESFDLVLICAGYEPFAVKAPGLGALLSQADRSGAVLGGLDTGTMVLARLGFLAGHEAVLHHEAEAGFRETWPEIAISDGIYCLDRRRLTAAGGTATGDAMLAWISGSHSDELAASTSEAMAHGTMRGGAERQRRQNTLDPVLVRMTEIMNAHVSHPIAISEIARVLDLSPKRLRNRSLRGLGQVPSQIYLRLRLEHALDLLRNTELPVTDIAIATGFGSLAGFSRTFKTVYQATPRRFRAGTK